MFSHENSGFHTNDAFATTRTLNLSVIGSFSNHEERSQCFSNSKTTLNVAAEHINCRCAQCENEGHRMKNPSHY